MDTKQDLFKKVKLFEYKLHPWVDAYRPEDLLIIAQEKSEEQYPNVDSTMLDVVFRTDREKGKYCEVYLLVPKDFDEKNIEALKSEIWEWILEELE